MLQAAVSHESVRSRGDNPAQDENTDNQNTNHAKVLVEIAYAAPEPPVHVELIAENSQHLNASDYKGDEYGDRSDGHVVIELANRVDECPAVSPEHQNSIDGINQTHPCREEQWKEQRGPEGHGMGGCGGRDSQQSDLRRGFKAQPEEKADEIHLP